MIWRPHVLVVIELGLDFKSVFSELQGSQTPFLLARVREGPNDAEISAVAAFRSTDWNL
jgi:hypothetical protein